MSPQRLQVGMYVVELDRPWHETPFPFQGFEVKSAGQIDALARHCNTVFIDPHHVSAAVTGRARVDANGDASLLDAPSATAALEAGRVRLFTMLAKGPVHEYGKPTNLKRESAKAVEAFDESRRRYRKLVSALKAVKPVRAAHCRNVVEPIAVSVMRNPDALSWLSFVYKNDPQPNDRSLTTAVWASVFARYLKLGPNVLLDIASGAMLLDIGLMKVPATVRNHAGRYDARQRMAMQTHVRLGEQYLREIAEITPRVKQMQSQHHERQDGSGYPRSLEAGAIGSFGAFAAVIDSYDAMVTDAPHRPSLSSADAIGRLKRLAPRRLPELVVEQFVQALGMFPSGSLVELNTGEVAIVNAQDEKHRLRPLLLVVTDTEKNALRAAKRLALADVKAAGPDRSARWIKRGLPTGSYGIDPYQYFF
ncbi:MAG: DUF3391 domain-containing protein [Pseudomonadota bacterium]